MVGSAENYAFRPHPGSRSSPTLPRGRPPQAGEGFELQPTAEFCGERKFPLSRLRRAPSGQGA